MKLGFDLDGVVFNSTPAFVAEGVRLGLIPPEVTAGDITHWDLGDQFGLQPEVACAMWAPEVYGRAVIYKEALPALRKLKSMGAELWFITARCGQFHDAEAVQEVTRAQLGQYGLLDGSNIIWSPTADKAAEVDRHKLDHYVDDHPLPIELLYESGYQGAWLMARRWNENVYGLPRTNWHAYFQAVHALLKGAQ